MPVPLQIPKKQDSTRRAATIVILTITFCLVGAVNSVLSKFVADKYTQRFAFFVDQGANIGYGALAGVPVLYQWLRGQIPAEGRTFPQKTFACMGLLDALATYFTSVGAVHTPGQLQTVLGQLLIPASMLASYVVLKSRYSGQAVSSAMIVFLGACVAVGPAVFSGGSSTSAWPPAILIFAAGNLPSALSGVYKESAFADKEVDVWLLTFVTTLYQILWSFALLLLQTFPYLSGSAEGMSLAAAWGDFVGGCACFAGVSPDGGAVDCTNAGASLVVYVVVNLAFGLIGLLLVKVGSDTGVGQVLCSLASAVKLPVSTVLFACPLVMGARAEQTQPATWVGLVFVVGGFLWHLRAGTVDDEDGEGPMPPRRQTTGIEAMMLGTTGPHRSLALHVHEASRAKTEGAAMYLPYSKSDLGAKLLRSSTIA
mmetsp:Transcript_143438/g.357417  ORF Transcript_143438/g.357417 Transcript_143438/m.357417 type:complete len:426 (-) Transcript_143438:440-1717(-)